MIISTSSHNIQLTREIDIIANEALYSDLEQLNDDISSIDVFLNAVSGSKANTGKQVIIRVDLRNGRKIAVETIEEDVTTAIRLGSKRVKRALFETDIPPQRHQLAQH
jgi:hypothetical protein